MIMATHTDTSPMTSRSSGQGMLSPSQPVGSGQNSHSLFSGQSPEDVDLTSAASPIVMPGDRPEAFRLLDLPGEILSLVCKEAVTLPHCIRLFRLDPNEGPEVDTQHLPDKEPRITWVVSREHEDAFAFAATCKQVRCEALRSFFSSNTFCYEEESWKQPLDALHRWLVAWRHYTPFIKRFVIDLEYSLSLDDEKDNMQVNVPETEFLVAKFSDYRHLFGRRRTPLTVALHVQWYWPTIMINGRGSAFREKVLLLMTMGSTTSTVKYVRKRLRRVLKAYRAKILKQNKGNLQVVGEDSAFVDVKKDLVKAEQVFQQFCSMLDSGLKGPGHIYDTRVDLEEPLPRDRFEQFKQSCVDRAKGAFFDWSCWWW